MLSMLLTLLLGNFCPRGKVLALCSSVTTSLLSIRSPGDAAEQATAFQRIVAKHVLMLFPSVCRPLLSNSLSSSKFSKGSVICMTFWKSRLDELMEVKVVHKQALRGSLSCEQFEQENPVAIDIAFGWYFFK